MRRHEREGLAVATVIFASLIAGGLLGLRFKVLVLLPLVVVWLIFAFGVVMAHTGEFWWTMLQVALVPVGLQIGYLAGAALLSWAGRNRLAPHSRTRTMAGAGSSRSLL